MKRFAMLCVLALTLCVVAMANLTPIGLAPTGTGPFTWAYQVTLSAEQNAISGPAPTISPVPHGPGNVAAFITVYDFAGYVPGSCSGPVGWTCTAQNVGFTPDDVVAADDAAIVNITWTYTSGATISGAPTGLNLGLFSAQSTFGTSAAVRYSARGSQTILGQPVIADNVGNTQAPTAPAPPPPTPLPPTLILTLSGLALAGLAAFAARKRTGMLAG